MDPTDLQLKSVTKKFLFVSNIRITPSFQLEFGHWLKKGRKRDTTYYSSYTLPILKLPFKEPVLTPAFIQT
jgi:hypothetical protein